MTKYFLTIALVAATLGWGMAAWASPGKTVCDARTFEMTWNTCLPAGVIVRGACAQVTASSTDFLGTPGLGYVYLQCPAPQYAACAAYAASLGGMNDASHCLDFYAGSLRSESTPLPAPEPYEFPQTWITQGGSPPFQGCDKLKAFVSDAGSVDLGGIDYHSIPASCSTDASFEDAGPALRVDAQAGDSGPQPTVAESSAPETFVEAGLEGVDAASDATPKAPFLSPKTESRGGCAVTLHSHTPHPVDLIAPLSGAVLLGRRRASRRTLKRQTAQRKASPVIDRR